MKKIQLDMKFILDISICIYYNEQIDTSVSELKGVNRLIASKKKLELAMARACMNQSDIVVTAKMPEPTVKNVMTGRSVRPDTLGRVAKALGVDPAELIEEA